MERTGLGQVASLEVLLELAGGLARIQTQCFCDLSSPGEPSQKQEANQNVCAVERNLVKDVEWNITRKSSCHQSDLDDSARLELG